MDVDYFTRLFLNCPHLDDVTIAVGAIHHDDLCKHTTVFQEALICPHMDVERPIHGIQPLNAVANAIHAAGRSLKRLKLDGISYLFLRQGPEKLSTMRDMMRSLREIKIAFEPPCEPPGPSASEQEEVLNDARACFREGQLKSLLSVATELRVLELSFPSDMCFVHVEQSVGVIPLGQAVGESTWRHLQQLSLRQVTTSEEELFQFLMRHRGSLERLLLMDMKLEEGTWASLIPRLSCSFPKLKEIEFNLILLSTSLGVEFDFDPDNAWPGESPTHYEREAFENYILHGGEYPDTDALRYLDGQESTDDWDSDWDNDDFDSDGGDDDVGGHAPDASEAYRLP